MKSGLTNGSSLDWEPHGSDALFSKRAETVVQLPKADTPPGSLELEPALPFEEVVTTEGRLQQSDALPEGPILSAPKTAESP